MGETKAKRRKTPIAGLNRAIKELDRVLVNGKPTSTFYARHLVALYVKLHTSVYGVEPVELHTGSCYFGATSAATKLVRSEFGDDMNRVLAFIRWVWQRERETEKWRRVNGAEGRRIGWHIMFAQRTLVTDYRLSKERSR